MSAESEPVRPNQFGFAGSATAPEPARDPAAEPDPERDPAAGQYAAPAEGADAEGIAVPAGDLTGAITAAIEEATERDDDNA